MGARVGVTSILGPSRSLSLVAQTGFLAHSILNLYILMSQADGKAAVPRPDVKPVVWCGSSLREVRAFPDDARREAGFQLGKLQEGKEANDWKPISIVVLQGIPTFWSPAESYTRPVTPLG